MQDKKIPTTVDPRYIHPVQPIVTNDDDLSFTVTNSEQLHIYDSITFKNTVTLEGDLIVKSSADMPDVHNTLLGLDGGETGYYGHLTATAVVNAEAMHAFVMSRVSLGF